MELPALPYQAITPAVSVVALAAAGAAAGRGADPSRTAHHAAHAALAAVALLIWLALQVPLGTRARRTAAPDPLTPYACPECGAPLTSTNVCKDPR